jgi:hypothetical protein
MRAKFIVPSLLALGAALAPTGASAQSVVTRSIATEPVETTVTQTPTGTIVTRRPVASVPLAGAPVVTAPIVTAPVVGTTLVETDTVDAIAARRAQGPTLRELVTQDVAARPQRSVKTQTTRAKQTRTTTRTRSVRPAPRISLSPSERQIVYQTIVEREVRPQVVPQQQIVVAPPVVQPVPAVRPAPIVVPDEVVVQQPAPVYTVGSVLPESTPLYAMPQNVALRVPATQSYGYAYLVDAPTGTIVADVTE